jgi:putative addiction module antidote
MKWACRLSAYVLACHYNGRYNTVCLKEQSAMTTVKVTTVGNSAGIVLPREVLDRLRVDKGDTLYVVETSNGVELTAYNPEFAAQIEAAERVMREDRDVLRKLAE